MLDLEQILSFYPEELRPFRSHVLREYLQYKILDLLYRSPQGPKLRFMGGTCIHILHGSPRFSEDLDFDNMDLSADEFEQLAGRIQRNLEGEGYTVELKTALKTAFRAYLRFPSILFESGLTGHREQKLLIQVDTEPQRFEYEPDTTILSKFDVFTRVRAVPADILLAQKLYCLFARPRTMGRDFFDAAFLMSKAQPNMRYLRERLDIGDQQALKARLLSRCDEVDLNSLAADVEPFVTKAEHAERVRQFRDYVESAL